MNRDYENMSAFEQIESGLHDAISHARGELSLKTVTLPPPPPSISPQKLVRLRSQFRMSQRAFAALLNVSWKSLKNWEDGSGEPRGGILRLLQVLGNEPAIVRTLHGQSEIADRRARTQR
ncbi:MAG TPA: hypothetical protein VL992_02145 [Tepidisphaeraceae bacterium]|nr:hypothetical protein [Tepidisphaeraceae bacterium]